VPRRSRDPFSVGSFSSSDPLLAEAVQNPTKILVGGAVFSLGIGMIAFSVRLFYGLASLLLNLLHDSSRKRSTSFSSQMCHPVAAPGPVGEGVRNTRTGNGNSVQVGTVNGDITFNETPPPTSCSRCYGGR
jgi:hypothetical protein